MDRKYQIYSKPPMCIYCGKRVKPVSSIGLCDNCFVGWKSYQKERPVA